MVETRLFMLAAMCKIVVSYEISNEWIEILVLARFLTRKKLRFWLLRDFLREKKFEILAFTRFFTRKNIEILALTRIFTRKKNWDFGSYETLTRQIFFLKLLRDSYESRKVSQKQRFLVVNFTRQIFAKNPSRAQPWYSSYLPQ